MRLAEVDLSLYSEQTGQGPIFTNTAAGVTSFSEDLGLTQLLPHVIQFIHQQTLYKLLLWLSLQQYL